MLILSLNDLKTSARRANLSDDKESVETGREHDDDHSGVARLPCTVHLDRASTLHRHDSTTSRPNHTGNGQRVGTNLKLYRYVIFNKSA